MIRLSRGSSFLATSTDSAKLCIYPIITTHSFRRPSFAKCGFVPSPTTKTSSLPRRRAPSPLKSSPLINEANLFSAHKVSSSSPIGLFQFLSLALVAVVLIVQFFSGQPLTLSDFSRHYPTTSYLPLAKSAKDSVCEIPHPFPTEPPISRPYKMSLIEEAKRIAAEFEYGDDAVNKGVDRFIFQMNEGLEKSGSTLSQIPTYVTAVPNGTEKGLYLAVDLGGTNFRVCSIELRGDTTFSLTQSKVAIPKELMQAKTSKELFAFLAKQIEIFLKKHHEKQFEAHTSRRQAVSTPGDSADENIFRLGFTFSFPVQQIGINKGTLIRWTKGFNIPDTIGKDVCALLQEEIDLLHLPVRVAALVNDTVGTLMSRAYTSPGKARTILGSIFGTGTNGAYLEKLSKITKPLEGDYDKSTGNMVVNSEWGSFDNELVVLPTTVYDKQLDANTVNPGIQMFEKRVSGMFLGELLRLALNSLINNKDVALFRDENSSYNEAHTTTTIADDSPLFSQWAVDSSILSIAAADTSDGLRILRLELDKVLGVSAASFEDAQAVKEIAGAIGRRAARLAAVAIAAIVLETRSLQIEPSIPSITSSVEKLDIDPSTIPEESIVDIGADGSLVEFYPRFEDHIRSALRIIKGIGPEGNARIRIGIAKDGSGVGAALIALVASQQEKDT